jgi:PhoPQ-activated pathogenicity-related protein
MKKLLAFVAATAVVALGSAADTARETALDRYVAQPDPSYSWRVVRSIPGTGYKTHVLELTSQTWRKPDEVDRPVWKHWLTIVEPDRVAAPTALLFIGGGSNRDPAPSEASARAAGFAGDTRTVVAELGMVPNQPLFFSDSREQGRSEDDLIAYSRVRQMATRDDNWLVRLAMVKSAVRAMDAVQEFCRSEQGGGVKIESFVVSGGSKRGWTTWLAAAVDRRVIAIMPTVIDALNSEAITRHHYAAYGFFSPALNDYVRHKLFPDKLGSPEYRAILAIEDPYNYRGRERMKMPKYLVNASGDQFFLPDNSQFYFGELQGEKHLRYVPNTKHSLAGTDARESLQAFYEAILAGRPRPRLSWKKQRDGSLVVTVQDRPAQVTLWQATNPKARDFRVDTIGNAYKSSPLEEQGKGVYAARVKAPEQGFTAFFVELVYPLGGKYPLKLTTEVSVVPDVLPFSLDGPRK